MPLKDFVDSYPALIGRLKQARLHDRIAHGYLFVGESITRIEKFAEAFMQTCICDDLTEDGDACGICRNCIGVERHTYPYMTELRPKSRSRQIVIDDVRELEHVLHLSNAGKTRLAVIYDADRMNEQTQNAFLKTLEEPTERTIIIMITCSPSNMLDTIRSRCQTISLHDNRIDYQAYLNNGLFETLATMRPDAGLVIAATASQFIRSNLKDLKDKFANMAEKELRELKVAAKDYAPARYKRLEEEIKALQEARYRGERINFLSALHAWFSQEFMRAEGITHETLPHAEFLDNLEPKPSPMTSVDARRNLELVEKLMETLQFNVDENLAVEDFCQMACAK